jgi:hypothetical protein
MISQRRAKRRRKKSRAIAYPPDIGSRNRHANIAALRCVENRRGFLRDPKNLFGKLPLRRNPLRGGCRPRPRDREVQLLKLRQGARVVGVRQPRLLSADCGRGLAGPISMDAARPRGAHSSLSFLQKLRHPHAVPWRRRGVGWQIPRYPGDAARRRRSDELASAPIQFVDGRNNHFDQAPADTRLL